MLFDTDIFIYIQRGNQKAATLLQDCRQRCISIITKMELLQGALNKGHHRVIQSFLHDFAIKVIPVDENTGYRASIYIEEYALSYNIRVADALIAATAVQAGLPLVSSNAKHFKAISGLELQAFRP